MTRFLPIICLFLFAEAAHAQLSALAASEPPPIAGMVQTFDYVPARDGLALVTGGPTDSGYLSQLTGRVNHNEFWQPRYIPQGSDAKGDTDTFNGDYQLNVDPEYAWSNAFTPFAIDANGNLRIRAQATSTAGFANGEVPTNPHTSAPYSYVSGVLSTKNYFAQQQGYFEITAQVPTCYACWPALWLMPLVETHPPELDILEVVGGYDPPTTYRSTVLAPTAPTSTATSIVNPGGVALSAGFHKYALAWNDMAVTTYFDGVVKATQDISLHPEFGQPFYLLMNMQMGSTISQWVPAPNGTTPATNDMLIKSVKVWQFPGPIGVQLSASSYLDSLAVGGTVATISAPCFGACPNETFTKLSDPDGMFAISGNSLTLAQSVPASTKASHQVTLQVTDGLGHTRQRLFTVNVYPGTPIQANYFAQSAISNAYFSKTNTTVSGSDILKETTANGQHNFSTTISRAAGVKTYTIYVEVTATLGRPEFEFQVFDSAYATQCFAEWNMVNVTMDYVGCAGTTAFNTPSASITPLANGSYRVSMTFTTDATTTGFQVIGNIGSAKDTFSYTGVTSDGMQFDNPWLYNKNAGAGGT